MPSGQCRGRPRPRFHGCWGAFSRFFTLRVRPENPRWAWLFGPRAAPVSVAPFGLTETGAGSSSVTAGAQSPAAVLVDGSALRHAAGSSTADDVERHGWLRMRSCAAHQTVQRLKAQVVDLAELASVWDTPAIHARQWDGVCAAGTRHYSYESPKAKGGTGPLKRPRPC